MKLYTRCCVVGLLLLAVILTTSCGTARRSEPIAGPLALDENPLVEGRRVFMVHCHNCHPGGEAGLGPALNNKPLPDFLIQIQVRNGLGVMPSFSPDEISAEEMDALLIYLRALRRHTPGEDSIEAGGRSN